MTTKKLPFETFVRSLDSQGVVFGGYVRDYLLGVEPTDIDVMVPDILRAVRHLSSMFTVEVLGDGNGDYSYGTHLKVKLSRPRYEDCHESVEVDLVTGPVYLDYTVNGLTMSVDSRSGVPHVGLLASAKVCQPGAGEDLFPQWKEATLLKVICDLAAKTLVPLRGKYSSGPPMRFRLGKMKKKGFHEVADEYDRYYEPNEGRHGT